MTGTLTAPPDESPAVSRTPDDPARRSTVPLAIVAIAAIAAIALLATRAGYVPLWDGRIYADCFNVAATNPFWLGALRCAGHPSHVYAGYMAAIQSLAVYSYLPLLVGNAILFAVACVGFHRLLKLAFPAPELALERSLVTAAFIVQPTFLANVVQPGLDLPLLPGFIWCVVFLIERRWVPLVLTGTAMAFSKETGVLLYAVLLASYGLWLLVQGTGPLKSRVISVLRLAPLALPGVLFVAHLLYRTRYAPAGEEVLWTAGTATIGQSITRQFLVPRLDYFLMSYLGILLVLNFAWIAATWVCADTFAGTVRWLRRLPPREVIGGDLRVIGFLALLTLGVSYALTRFATYANSRYLAPAMALLLLCFLATLLRVPLAPAARRSFIAVLAIGLVASNVRTIDPLSRRLWGTFPVGEREMLHMTSITTECCGYGRDQLVYGLEFTVFADLTSDALSSVQPGDSTVIIIPDETDWWNIETLDRATGRLTLRRDGAANPRVIEQDDVLVGKKPPTPVTAYYLALPHSRWEKGLKELATLYDIGQARWFRRGGYAMSLYPLRLRPGAEVAPAANGAGASRP